MKYMGSKARWASDILPIILEGRGDALYVEPFIGGGNTFHLVGGSKWGNDINSDVVAMLVAVANGWEPPSGVSESMYAEAKRGDLHSAMRGFIGIGCSYSGKFFGGYARGNDDKNRPRNYANESRKNILRQAPGLAGARYTSMPYDQMDIPRGSTIYCDPPYRGATGYGSGFDSDSFWIWCEKLSHESRVFVSEYSAPDGWDEVWSADTFSSLTANTGARRAIEKLFVKTGA